MAEPTPTTKTAAPTPAAQPRPPQVAVAPLDTIAAEDVAAASGEFDRWLRRISSDHVTLERLSAVVAGLPVIGNIIAFVDVLSDLVRVVDKLIKKQAVDFLDWVSLGINLIGVIPLPPAMAAARMTLRPMLHLVRQELKAGVRNIGDALVTVLVGHLNDKLAGELDTFVDVAMGKLDGLLQDCAHHCDGVADGLIDVLQRCIGDKPLFDLKPSVAEKALYDPMVQSRWGLMLGAAVRLQKRVANVVAGQVASRLPTSARATVLGAIAALGDAKLGLRNALVRLADEKAEKSIQWLLRRLLDAARRRRSTHTIVIPPNKGVTFTVDRPGTPLEAINRQVKPLGDPNPCKQCPAPGGTPHSISFATGCESLTHTDFTLAAPLPIAWQRTYRSNLGAYDQASLGARWLTPYGSRIDVVADGRRLALIHHGADGRSHRYPWLALGESHRDPVEEVSLTRIDETLLVLDVGKPLPAGEPSPWRETYELVTTCPGKVSTQGARHFRLAAIHTLDGASIGLRYDHAFSDGPCAGEAVLSDILSKQGETTVAHVGVQPDPQTGQIRALWEIRDGALIRQLAGYVHDTHGNLIHAQDENAAAWQYRYGETPQHHLLCRYTDRTGRGTNLQYDGTGANARAIREWADDGSSDMRLAWDEHIRLTYLTDALGHETWLYYDLLGYTYRVIHADAREEWFFRDAAKNLTRHVHPDGSTDDYHHDGDGNLLTHVRADASRVHFEYDKSQRLTGILNADGNPWRREYDVNGHLTAEIDPLGHTTEYAYDKAGRLTRITDAKGGVKTLTYTAPGQLASYTDCSGHTTRWEYDSRARLMRHTDAAGHTTRYRYTAVTVDALQAAQTMPVNARQSEGNAPGQLATVIHPDETEAHLCHDAEGRLLAHTDALGRRTAYRYNPAGLIDERIDALGQRLHYRWDMLGRLVELRNENDQPYSFAYDPVGRLLQETGFDGRATHYRYTEASGQLAEVDDGGVTTYLRFDPMGRLTQRQATAPGQPEQTETFSYYPGGQLGEARNEHARLLWVYDAAGNLVREHQQYQGPLHPEPRTAIWQHRYDALNQRSGTTRPDGHSVDWLSYGAGHVHGILLDGNEVAGFERDALHREVLRTQGNGLVRHQRFDAMGRLTEQRLTPTHYRGPVEPDQGLFKGHDAQVGTPAGLLRRYTYDKAGSLDHIEDNRRGRIEYRYDPVGQLVKATGGLHGIPEAFAFDPAGNILQPDPQAEHLPASRKPALPKVLDNLLKEYAGTTYRYDERGNLVERLEKGWRSRFAWDAFNRLQRAQTPQSETDYAYDPLGRRIIKRSRQHVDDWKSGRSTQTTQTVFGWDGDTLAFETHGDAHRGATVHYVYEPGSFVPLLQARQNQRTELPRATDIQKLKAGNGGEYDIALDPLWNGALDGPPLLPFTRHEIAFYQCDHLGTPQELTDSEGKIAWVGNYRAWGFAKTVTGEEAKRIGLTNPIRFQGQYFDEETGLHYNRYRYYDPHSGRYLCKDPIGLYGGFNQYQFAPNATIWFDPLGLARRSKDSGSKAEMPGPRCCRPCPESDHLYRGVSVRHPAYQDAKRGVVTPAMNIGGATSAQHNEGGYSGASQYTSWSRDKKIAQYHANKDGPGGVLLSAPIGAPSHGDCWSWEFSEDIYGEGEVLLKGPRYGLGVHEP